MPSRSRKPVRDLADLVSRFHQVDSFRKVVTTLQEGQSAAIDGAWGSSCALATAALAVEAPEVLLVVLPRLGDVDEFADDMSQFLNAVPHIFPAWESLPQEHDVADIVFGARLRVLRDLLAPGNGPRIVVASLPALLQPIPTREAREAGTRRLRVGDEVELEDFLRWLVDCGFERVTGLELPGEFSMHGGIVDIYPPDALDPLRIEFFGDEIESIRRFDVETQRKVDDLDEVAITLVAPAGEIDSGQADAAKSEDSPLVSTGEHFVDSLPTNSWVAFVELQECIEEARNYLQRLDEPRGLYSVNATLARCTEFPSVTIAPLAADSVEISCHLQIESIERFTGPKSEVVAELASIVDQDEQMLIACHNAGELERLQELLVESGIPIADRVTLCVGRLARGFRLVAERLVVLSDHELFRRTEIRRSTGRRRTESRTIDSFLDLKEGDLIVHLAHGIGRFRGMKVLEKDDQAEEHLIVEFRDKVHVYVPVSLIHLVQKYIGGAKSAPELSKLGTTSWAKKKAKVTEAVTDLAVDMLRMQAAREAKPGIACPPDTHWQKEFEAAFPYTETPDQLAAISDCKEDLERSQPMDRLICGDVGYGKTEVATRAAFKVIDSGRQVALLVPTTILAEQHFRTLSERMAEYPVTIEMLSRFKTKGQQKRTLANLEAGTVDLVVGTHRLVQNDVRFKNLGLLIIDEEQRFGVSAKEMLKMLRLEVDILTLSATPIPRTLHMALLGIRDISNLLTAPQDRTAIVTRICRFDADLIRQAIVRELNRNGQVYFVHNRVYNIQSVADRLRQIVPEAKIDIAHGQMHADDLEAAMLGFVSASTDILVCTTIIESGLDIPNANTIFIHEADKYGLADLHQLRGRVGRYKHRAYCYLLLEEGRTLTSTAAKRMKAIEEFSELGAGFKIAMRDLEIRGAGNILGTEQSGHIISVGYELYCQLLENAVRRLKHEPLREYRHVSIDLPISAFFPNSYVPPGRTKIEMYRKLSAVATWEELAEVENEIRDRFGPIPTESVRLFELKRLQLHARHWHIDDIHLEDKFAVLRYRSPKRIRELVRQSRNGLRIVDGKHVYLPLPNKDASGDDLLAELKSVLQPK